MSVNVNDKTRDYNTAVVDSSKPSTGNSHVDLLVSGKAVIEHRPDQQQPTAIRPR